jgi:hypothetical protein
LKIEVSSEKENLHRLMGQMQDIFNSIDIQRQKLQNFIEETREQFKTGYPAEPSPPPSLDEEVNIALSISSKS